MLKYATILAVLLVAVTAVSAAPSLSYTRTDVGGGLFAYDFFIQNNDGLLASYTATLAFQAGAGSTINQTKVMGIVAVDKQADAILYEGTAGWTKATDTWIYSPFGDNFIPGTSPRTGDTFTGVRQGDGWFEFSTATGAGSALGSPVNVLHLVAGGLAAGTWSGTIARSSVLYTTSGSYVPEPATMALLATGALALIRRRR